MKLGNGSVNKGSGHQCVDAEVALTSEAGTCRLVARGPSDPELEEAIIRLAKKGVHPSNGVLCSAAVSGGFAFGAVIGIIDLPFFARLLVAALFLSYIIYSGVRAEGNYTNHLNQEIQRNPRTRTRNHYFD